MTRSFMNHRIALRGLTYFKGHLIKMWREAQAGGTMRELDRKLDELGREDDERLAEQRAAAGA